MSEALELMAVAQEQQEAAAAVLAKLEQQQAVLRNVAPRGGAGVKLQGVQGHGWLGAVVRRRAALACCL